jgi:hypothetical protein
MAAKTLAASMQTGWRIAPTPTLSAGRAKAAERDEELKAG